MLVFTKLEPDFSKGLAHPAAQPPVPATHPRRLTLRELTPEHPSRSKGERGR
jgi:hypothetical protein